MEPTLTYPTLTWTFLIFVGVVVVAPEVTIPLTVLLFLGLYRGLLRLWGWVTRIRWRRDKPPASPEDWGEQNRLRHQAETLCATNGTRHFYDGRNIAYGRAITVSRPCGLWRVQVFSGCGGQGSCRGNPGARSIRFFLRRGSAVNHVHRVLLFWDEGTAPQEFKDVQGLVNRADP